MIRINLLPVRAEKRKENVRKHGLLLVLYVVFLVIIIVTVHLSELSSAKAKAELIQKQEADIVALDATIKEVQNYKAKLADLTDKLNVVVGLEQKQRGPARVFGEIAKVIPEKLWIDKLTDNGGSLQIDGWAIDQQTVALFMMNLEASNVFQKVTLKVTKRTQKAGVELQNFSLEARVTVPVTPTALAMQVKGGTPAQAQQPVAPVATPAPAPTSAAPAPAGATAKPAAPAQPQPVPPVKAPAASPAKAPAPAKPAKPAPAPAPKPAKAG